jgi:AhpD family alkylhydroperoxidase
MKNPALLLDGAGPAIQALLGSIFQSGVPRSTLDIVGLRVAQMNSCELCIAQSAAAVGDDDRGRARLAEVARWDTSSAFTPPEKSALELAEAVTALKLKYDSVSDALWSELRAHYTQRQLAGLVMHISVMNMFTRINVGTRQLEADWATDFG